MSPQRIGCVRECMRHKSEECLQDGAVQVQNVTEVTINHVSEPLESIDCTYSDQYVKTRHTAHLSIRPTEALFTSTCALSLLYLM